MSESQYKIYKLIRKLMNDLSEEDLKELILETNQHDRG